MSELSPDNEPNFVVDFPTGEFEATRDNTILFTFMGKLALYNHIYFVRDEEEGTGVYLFNQHPVFTQISEHLIENDFQEHLNLRQVADCDVEAYNQMVVNEVTAELSDDSLEAWLNGDQDGTKE